jgi:hypothetical protein
MTANRAHDPANDAGPLVASRLRKVFADLYTRRGGTP